MRCSFYLSNCLKLWIINHGTFDGIEKSKVSKRLKEEFAESKLSRIEDFLYGAIGYKDDQNMTSSKRAFKRKEVIMNLNSNKYWIDEARKLGFDRTSKVVENFEYLEVLGIRKISGVKTSKYSFKGFNKFVEENSSLVDLFCIGADEIKTCLTMNGTSLKFKDFKSALKSDSYLDFIKKKKSIGFESEDLLAIKSSNSIKLVNKTLYLPNEMIKMYSKGFILECLLYAYTISANVVPVQYKSLIEDLLEKVLNPFYISSTDFLYLMDLSYMLGKSIKYILEQFNHKIPEIDEMIDKTHGLYIYDSSNNSVSYIPDSCKDSVAIPCVFNLQRFIMLANSKLYSDIVYSKGIPLLNGRVIDGSVFGGR